jgi:hypothetical protein
VEQPNRHPTALLTRDGLSLANQLRLPWNSFTSGALIVLRYHGPLIFNPTLKLAVLSKCGRPLEPVAWPPIMSLHSEEALRGGAHVEHLTTSLQRNYFGSARRAHTYLMLIVDFQYDIYAGEVAEWVCSSRACLSPNNRH